MVILVGRRSAAPAVLSSVDGLRAVVDSVEANIFVADVGFRLVYANRRALRTCQAIEADLRDAFGVGVADLLFGSIHRFHKDPGRIERLLKDPRNLPHRATFQFGEVTLATNINAVTDEAGAVLGYCVAWEEVSAQRRLSEQVVHVADDLSGASTRFIEVTAGLGSQAATAAEQAGAAAAATEQMSASIQEISSNTAAAVTTADGAVTAAASATESLHKLTASSQEIGSVVEIITSIAEQTNLLALNATIEAARAGDAGRGFAVVATEVKDLAQETAQATDRITRMIKTLQQDSTSASAAIAAITDLIGRISHGQATIAGAVEEQSATTNEISRSVGQIAGTTQAITADLATLTRDAHALAATAQTLRGLVDEARQSQNG
ncbi:MAG TPA: methyl-accepting chemotaxis protein [Kineosporiaceae bacterium]